MLRLLVEYSFLAVGVVQALFPSVSSVLFSNEYPQQYSVRFQYHNIFELPMMKMSEWISANITHTSHGTGFAGFPGSLTIIVNC